MHYLMHGVGIFSENTCELVGKDVGDREKSKESFKGVLRMICDAGTSGDRKAVLSAKKTLRMLLFDDNGQHCRRLESVQFIEPNGGDFSAMV